MDCACVKKFHVLITICIICTYSRIVQQLDVDETGLCRRLTFKEKICGECIENYVTVSRFVSFVHITCAVVSRFTSLVSG